ncbi:MAG: tRNA 4-thiouridine(8) synthase ThiI [Actinomycetota bacterium]|nr:tRNA 4-thiouridine(8) synthase ThiI [Actinomycetota bacterium]
MTPDLLLVHYHEIGLKGRNRPRFERQLKHNLERALGDSAGRVRLVSGRVEVLDPKPDALERASRVFGVANVSPVRLAPADLDKIVERAVEVAGDADAATGFETFEVRARRARTPFPHTSQRVNELAGDAIRIGLGKRVDLSDPDLSIRIEIVHDRAYISGQKFAGPGGLPVGTAGPVVALLSAGIDSPVAAWRMMRRGADPIAVHFHGQPFTDRSSERKVDALLDVLRRWGYRRPWWSVPMGEAQREITLSAPSPLRVLLYRRLMLRVAEAIGAQHGALAVVTGESLGQVASQTLENMAAVEAVATLPVLRPLVGTDKVEIIDEARRIGTYDVSAEAHQDCCTLFEPREPATHATAAELDAAEDLYDLAALVKDCVERAERRPPSDASRP